MAIAAATWGSAAIRAGLVVGADLGRSWAEQIPPPFETVVSGHPLPTAASEDAGRRALALADSVRPDETVLVLVSGGATNAAGQVTQPTTNYAPTLRVPPGKSISVFVAHDLDFSAAGSAK